MFPEFCDLISRLKTSNGYFVKLFDRHNELDQTIRNIESGIAPAGSKEIETLKKEKLQLKDRLYVRLQKASSAA
jgi:hypothetical protein